MSGGRSERSSESGDLLRDEARECCGEGMSVVMVIMFLERLREFGGMWSCGTLREVTEGQTVALCTRLRAGYRMRLPFVSDAAPPPPRTGSHLRCHYLRQLFPHLLATSALLLRP